MNPHPDDPTIVRANRAGRLLLLLLAAGFALPASSTRADDEPALNTMCPVMPDEPVDPKITVVYRGKKIAFCCDNCLDMFNANPDAYLSELPQFRGAPAAPSDTPPTVFDRDGERASNAPGAAPVPRTSDSDDDDDAPAAASRRPLLGRLHPAIVHFPIAAAPLALLGLLLWMWTRREAFARADVPPLFLGAAAAVAAYFSGNNAEEHKRFSPRLHEIVEQHEQFATIVMWLLLALVVYRLWRWNRLTGPWRWTYALALIAATALLGLTGYLGGSLVFGPDHLRL